MVRRMFQDKSVFVLSKEYSPVSTTLSLSKTVKWLSRNPKFEKVSSSSKLDD